MGKMEVPSSALYGASTQRAVLNFPVSGQRMPLAFIRGLAHVKAACAVANGSLGELQKEQVDAILQVTDEVLAGLHDTQFPVDVFQTGSGTSTNMNLNEVIANRCSELAGEAIGSKKPVHPNDHCNRSQSSNDVIPTALHVSIALALKDDLIPALTLLAEALEEKAATFESVVKIGRTHLMDATPVTMGQVFSGYAAHVRKAIRRCSAGIHALSELAIGGTAVGTGINCPEGFAARVANELTDRVGIRFHEAENHFEAQGGRDDVVEVAGYLLSVSAGLAKIANDIRLMGSGPRSGLGELQLPATQPGSSIMPGKVNPVMSEMLVQACIFARGQASIVAECGRDGHFELNVTLPLIAKSMLDAIQVLANGSRVFAVRCVQGIEVNAEQCAAFVERSLMLVTALNPHIGYDAAAKVAKTAFAEKKTLREVVLEMNLLDPETLDQALDPRSMT